METKMVASKNLIDSLNGIMMRKKFFLTFILISSLNFCFAKVQLPSILADHMVLQQKSKVNLWGKGNVSSKLTVNTSWDNKNYTAIIDNEGNWLLSINTPKAGGPYSVSFNDGESLTLNNILIGEVWVCSGQSNMAMPLAGFDKGQPILNSKMLIENSANNQLRLFKVERLASATPQTNCVGNWQVSDSVSAAKFSALAFQYGQMLQKKLGVPVGVIESSWGGTAILPWTPIDKIDESKKITQTTSGALYNGMLAPIKNYTIKGFLWYQGETDRFAPNLYKDKMIKMVQKWRAAWNQGDIPFYFVQIAPYEYKDKVWSSIAELREAQLAASHEIPNSEMVVTLDLGMAARIHPPDKTTVATRLLSSALAKTYHQNVAYQFPEYISMKEDGKSLLLKFKNAKGLYLKKGKSENFEIAGKDSVFYKADVQVLNNKIKVNSDKVDKPIAVRYGFKNFLVGDLFNENDIPATPFRTDNWPSK